MSEVSIGAWLEAIAAHRNTTSPGRQHPPLRLPDNALTDRQAEVCARLFHNTEDEK